MNQQELMLASVGQHSTLEPLHTHIHMYTNIIFKIEVYFLSRMLYNEK